MTKLVSRDTINALMNE